MATENDKVNTGALTTLVLVGLFATLSIALAVTALVRYSVEGVTSQRQTFAQQEYRELKRAQADKISQPRTCTDKGKGLVSLPIDRAKSKVLADLQRDPTSASPPPPAPSAAPTEPTGEIQMLDESNTPAAPAPNAAVPPKSEHAALDKPKPAVAASAPTVAVAQPPAPTTAQPAPAAPKAAPAPTAPAPKPTDG